jgi:hypothetical protein
MQEGMFLSVSFGGREEGFDRGNSAPRLSSASLTGLRGPLGAFAEGDCMIAPGEIAQALSDVVSARADRSGPPRTVPALGAVPLPVTRNQWSPATSYRKTITVAAAPPPPPPPTPPRHNNRNSSTVSGRRCAPATIADEPNTPIVIGRNGSSSSTMSATPLTWPSRRSTPS